MVQISFDIAIITKSALLAVSLAILAAGSPCAPQPAFKYLVAFGDSYTDDGLLDYYVAHDDSSPPPGTVQPQINDTAGGGYTWTQDVAKYTGATNDDFAIAGTTCSNAIISLYLAAINAPLPDIVGAEIPTFKSDLSTDLYAGATAENTVYSVWIGTNNIGWGAFLSDSQAPGTNLTSHVECVWSVFDAIYESGGRCFVLFNNNALQLVPMYKPTDQGEAGDNQYWLNKTRYNTTEYAGKIMEYTTTVNTVFEYGVPYRCSYVTVGLAPNSACSTSTAC